VRVRVVRLSALAVVVGVLAAVVPSLGLSGSPTFDSANQECGRVEYASGLEAVFGRRATHAQAIAFRNLVLSRGFVNAFIVNDCPSGFRIVVRGIDSFDIGVELQGEAYGVGFKVTLECIKGKEIGRYEVIFGHGRDRPTTQAILNRVAAAGIGGVKTRPDPCGGFEVYLFAAFKDQREAEAYAAQVKARGLDVVVERN
jgi:hypothetical protein